MGWTMADHRGLHATVDEVRAAAAARRWDVAQRLAGRYRRYWADLAALAETERELWAVAIAHTILAILDLLELGMGGGDE